MTLNKELLMRRERTMEAPFRLSSSFKKIVVALSRVKRFFRRDVDGVAHF